MRTAFSERFARGLLSSLAKDWDPGEHPRDPIGQFAPKGMGAVLPPEIAEKISADISTGRFDPPAEVKNRKFQVKETHHPTEEYTKKVWDEGVVPYMKEAGVSEEGIKWATKTLWRFYTSTDDEVAWGIQAAVLLASGASKEEVTDRVMRSGFDRRAGDTNPQRAEIGKYLRDVWEKGNPKPEGEPLPYNSPKLLEGETHEQSMARGKQHQVTVWEWQNKLDETIGFPERYKLQEKWETYYRMKDLMADIDKIVQEAEIEENQKAAAVIQVMSREMFRRAFPEGATVYRGIRDEDETQMPWRMGRPRRIEKGAAERVLAALNENPEISVNVDGFTSWTPIQKAAEEFMTVQHEGKKKPSATPAAIMFRKKVTADDVMLYWPVGYAHNMCIDTAEVQIGHRDRSMVVRREDIHMVKGRDVDEPEWVKRPEAKKKVKVEKAKRPKVNILLSYRPKEWQNRPGSSDM